MYKVLYDLNEVKEKIAQNKTLLLAGDEQLLRQLPAGNWIAGTIPYFMGENGGVFTKNKIFISELPAFVKSIDIKFYDVESIANIYKEGPVNGFTIVIIPAFSPTHHSFALNAPNYEGFATNLLIGWISGVDLKEIPKSKPKVIIGKDNVFKDDGAVAMHVTLPDNKFADVNVINIFKQGSGDTITFLEDGFSAVDAIVNGKRQNFAKYLLNKNIDTKLPLIAEYCGTMVNISVQNIDTEKMIVTFYAPVFRNVFYKFALPIKDYVTSFNDQVPTESVDKIFFSCNCILNYIYSELEKKQTGTITGPITFGEIACLLLNQTLAYVKIEDA
jgi:hypothetical protein